MATRVGALAALALVLACGGGDSDGAVADASTPDAALADAALADAAAPVTHWYVVDSLAVPMTAGQAMEVGLDLDQDGEVDNALGALFAAIESQSSHSIRLRTANAVAAGRIIELHSIDASSLDDADVAAAYVLRGADPDGDPDDNFSGSESFALDPLEGTGGPLYGAIEGGSLEAGPGQAAIQLAFDREVPVLALPALSARIRCQVAESGLEEGAIGGAFTEDMVIDQLLPAMRDGIQATIDRDCTGGVPPCPEGSDGEAFLLFFDDNQDLMVTVDELMANSLLAATIGNPDLDLLNGAGQPDPQGDGVNDSLSFGFGFTAVGAAPPAE